MSVTAEQKKAPDFDLPLAFVDLQAQRRRIADRLEAAVMKVMEGGAYILGPEVIELQKQLAAFAGAKHCLAVSNGTDALALGLMAKKTRPGDAVIVPSFTFAATAEVVAWFGAAAVFADCDADSFNIDAASIERGVETAKAKGLRPVGIIPVDLFGLPADYDAIQKIADAHGMWVMADSAQGFGCEYKGRRSGAIGDMATTSFFPAKPLGCYGDGGAIFTNDDDLFKELESLRFHGKGADKYDNIRIGMNARLDTMQAAILLEKLAIYADELDARDRVAAQYTARLADHVKTPVMPSEKGMRCVWAQYTLTLPKGADREGFVAHMKEHGVPVMVYYPKPLHRQTAYQRFPVAGNGLPVCEDLSGRVVSLPMHPYMTPDMVDYVADQAIAYFKRG